MNKLIKSEIQVFSKRIERHPQDSRLKYELGKRYMRIKRNKDAIKLFQQSVADKRIETEVYVLMGECFLNESQVPLAKRQFEKALPNLNSHDDEDFSKPPITLWGGSPRRTATAKPPRIITTKSWPWITVIAMSKNA